MVAPHRVGRVRVWVLPAAQAGANASFPWSLDFVEEKRLIPIQSSKAPAGLGRANFRMLRARRDDGDGDGLVNDPGQIVAGAYIAITAGTDEFTVEAPYLRWWGYISKVNRRPIAGTDDEIGTVEALGPGYLIDGGRLQGWQQADGAGDRKTVKSPPTWNLTDHHGTVVGNVTDIELGLEGDPPVFTRSTTLCEIGVGARYGSRLELLKHLCAFCVPEYLPSLLPFDMSGNVFDFLDDTTLPEVIDPRECTLRGAIDLVVSRARGFGWTISIADGGKWFIDVYPLISADDDVDSSYPTAAGTEIDLGEHDVEDFQTVEDGADLYDAVEVLGARIVHCSGLAMNDNGDKAWADGQETSYRAASAVNPDEKISDWKQRNAQLRASPSLCDVFTRFKVKEPDTGPLGRSALPGEEDSDPETPFFPKVVFTGSGTPTLDDTDPQDPYWPTSRILRTIPWPEGVKADGTDTRNQAAKVRPTYLKPRIFRYLEDATVEETGLPWQDLTISYKQRGGVEAECDDRLPALIVRMCPPELLAKNHWDSDLDAKADVDPNITNAKRPPVDWETLVFTVAMESDQRVSYLKIRPGLSEDQVRRVLPLTYEQLECWVVHAGTVLGVTAAGAAERVPDPVFTRNEFPIAKRLADTASAWAFRTRSSATIVLTRVDEMPEWAEIGTMISTAVDGEKRRVINTVVENETTDWNVDSPRTTITTTIPDRPDFKGQAGVGSPTAGGAISVALSGTVPQAVQALRGQVATLSREIQRLPLIQARQPSADDREALFITNIEQAAHGFVVGDWLGRDNDGTWIKAKPLDFTDLSGFSGLRADVVGVVTQASTDNFSVATEGYVTDLPQTFDAGDLYWLSESTPGTIEQTPNNLSVLCFVANGEHEGYVRINHRARGQFYTITGYDRALGKVLDASDFSLAAAATVGAVTGANDFINRTVVVVVNHISATSCLVCFGGYFFLPSGTIAAQSTGAYWLDPATAGGVIATKPVSGGRAVVAFLADHFNLVGNPTTFFLPPNANAPGLGQCWDVDLVTTPPVTGDSFTFDGVRWGPGPAGLGDVDALSVVGRGVGTAGPYQFIVSLIDDVVLRRTAGILSWGKVEYALLDDLDGYSVLGNGSASADTPGPITATDEGVILNRKDADLEFTQALELGDITVGGGTVLINIDGTKYVEIDSDGYVTVFHDTDHQVHIGANCRVQITWPNTNSVDLNPSDITTSSTVLKWREMDHCDAAGVIKKYWVLTDAGH